MLMRKISLGALFALALFASSAVAGVVDKKAALGGYDGFVERMGAGTRELGRGNTGSADTARTGTIPCRTPGRSSRP